MFLDPLGSQCNPRHKIYQDLESLLITQLVVHLDMVSHVDPETQDTQIQISAGSWILGHVCAHISLSSCHSVTALCSNMRDFAIQRQH